MTSQSLLTRPEYQGTILRDMLEAKPKNGGDRIAWKQNAREEAQDNFDFVKNRVRDMQCRSTPSDTLLVHLRAGDAVGTEYKEIPDVDASAQRVVQYAKERPGIKRIEISGVLHFGVPDPNDAFYQSNGGFEVVKDDSGEPRYRVTDAILQKNGPIVNRFIREGATRAWRCGSPPTTTRTPTCAASPRRATSCPRRASSASPRWGTLSHAVLLGPARRPALEPQELQLSRARRAKDRECFTYDCNV